MDKHHRIRGLRSALTRSRRRVLLLSLSVGLGIWVLDAFLDWLYFYEGTFLSLLVTGVPAHELYGRTLFVASVLVFGEVVWRLIRDRRAREDDLSLFRALIDESNDGVFVIDEDTGHFLDVNQRACDVLGYDRAELLEMGVPDIEVRVEDNHSYKRFIRSDEGSDFERRRFRHRRADGTDFPVDISASSVEVNGGTYRLAIARDVSDRVAMEEHLRQSEERYRSLFASIRDAILVADTDRRIVECNPAFTSLFGYELEEIRGKPTQYIYENEAEFEHLGTELGARGPESNFFVTVNYERKSGDVFPGETNVFSLVDDENNVTGFVGLIRDVSGRMQREQQLKVIDRILRHNLRNDLNVIMGNVEVIDERTNGAVTGPTKRIEETSKNLIELADKERKIVDLLTGDPQHFTIDLERACSDVVEHSMAEHPGTTVDVSCPGDLQIRAIPDFQEALEELVANAVKHGEGAQSGVSIESYRTDGTVTIRVSDDGPGLPEEDVNVLLGTERLEPLSHGSGLGLWLVNLVVSRSNGSIRYETGTTGGATIDLVLPVDGDSS